MGDKSDLINDDEYQYEYDENILSLYSQLSKKRHNTQSDSDGNSSLIDDLNLDELSDNERFVLKSIAFLGGITVEKEVFNSWLGGQYADTISCLIEKGLIQKRGSSQKIELSLQNEISVAVLQELRPDLLSCSWVKDLCENISRIINKQAQEYKRTKPGGYELPNEITSTRWHGLSRLLSEVLNNLDYKKTENVIFCIENLTKVLNDDLDCEWRYEINIDRLLNQCMTSPCFTEISGAVKFDAYCLQLIMLLESLRRLHPNRDSIQSIDDKINQIMACMSMAESSLNGLPSEVKLLNGYRIFLPILEIVCYFETISIKMFSNKDAVLELCYFVVAIMGRIKVPKEKADEVAIKFRYFQALIDESLRLEPDEVDTRRIYRSIFGRKAEYEEAISGAESDNVFGTEQFDNEDHIRFRERLELDECYRDRLKNCVTLEEMSEILDELMVDPDLNSTNKSSLLFGRISALGFDSELSAYSRLHIARKKALENGDDVTYDMLGDDLNGNPSVEEYLEDMRQSSKSPVNQLNAKKCLEYLVPLVEQAEDPILENADRCAIQAVMLSLCMNDRDAVKKYTDMYFLYAIMDLDYRYNYMKQHYESLQVLCASSKEALALFVTRGIDYLEKEAARPQTPDKVLFPLYEALEVLAGCINDTEKIDHYKEKQQEVLGLGFRYIKPEQCRKKDELGRPIL